MKYRAVFVDVLKSDIELDTCDTRKGAEKVITEHKKKSILMLSLNPFALPANSNRYRIDEIYEEEKK